MGEENKNWFARHRTAVLGIAIAVLILNLVVMAVVPTQTPVALSQTVTEYALDDEAFARPHTFTLTGTLTKSVVVKPSFTGTLCITGLDALDEPVALRLERRDGRWEAWFQDAAGQPLGLSGFGLASFDADKTLDSILVCLAAADGEALRFLAPGMGNRHAALTRLYTYYPAYRTK